MDKILHQLIGSLSHYLQGFIHTRQCRISSINSMKEVKKDCFYFKRRYYKPSLRHDLKHMSDFLGVDNAIPCIVRFIDVKFVLYIIYLLKIEVLRDLHVEYSHKGGSSVSIFWDARLGLDEFPKHTDSMSRCCLPSRELTYPTLEKGTSSSKSEF